MKSISENFKQFYSNFKTDSIEMALANFKGEPFIKKYIPLVHPPSVLQSEPRAEFQEVSITFSDMSVFRAVEKIRNITFAGEHYTDIKV